MIDLIVAVFLTLLSIPVVLLTDGPFRVVLPVIVLLLLPGYCLMAALYPRNGSMQGPQKLVLSIVSSLAIVPLTMLALNFTPWGLGLVSDTAAMSTVILILATTAFVRRARLPREERPHFTRPRIRRPQLDGGTKADMVISLVLVMAIAGAGWGLHYAVTTPSHEDAFTDFYLLGGDGLIGDYPTELAPGESANVTVGVVNHENEDVDYSVDLLLDGQPMKHYGPVLLADEEEWSRVIHIAISEEGERHRVEFILRRGSETEPYRSLHLWIDVRERQ